MSQKSKKVQLAYLQMDKEEDIEKYLEEKHQGDDQESYDEEEEVIKGQIPGPHDPKIWSVEIIKSFKEKEVALRQ